ncbi:MAG: nucleotidyltransferase family protein [Candidatus Nezhaarchaeota archaeon]|nr:nucleotidyltransferase family protein [Candidatus Nezhaarchaeota archaeon]
MGLDVIILAGGFAKRLRPISDVMPKPLLHIDGVPLLNHVLEKILEIDYNRIIISTNKKFEGSFRYWMKTLEAVYEKIKIFLSVEPSQSEEEKFGAIGGLSYTIKLFNVDNSGHDLLVILGDNLFDFDLKGFVSYGARLNRIVIGAYNVKDPEVARRYGVIEVDENYRVTSFLEKPEKPPSTLISVGIYYVPNRFIQKIDEFLKLQKYRDAVGKFFEWLSKNTEVYAYEFTGYWTDIGTPESYLEANRWASERNLGRRWQWP